MTEMAIKVPKQIAEANFLLIFLILIGSWHRRNALTRLEQPDIRNCPYTSEYSRRKSSLAESLSFSLICPFLEIFWSSFFIKIIRIKGLQKF